MSPTAWTPVDGDRLDELLAGWITESDGGVRVAIDGPPCARPGERAASLIEALKLRGRPAVHVASESFWQDASLRLEHGREDVESYLSWTDFDALNRETIEPFGAREPFLTSLRDPVTNRSTRDAPREFEPGTVLLVSGSFLLGRGLAFERTVHLFLPADARARRTPPDEAWTLPAYERYDALVDPVNQADVAVRLDRRSPAVRGLVPAGQP